MADLSSLLGQAVQDFTRALLMGPGVPVPENKPTDYIRKRHREEYVKLASLGLMHKDGPIMISVGPPSFNLYPSNSSLADLRQASIRDLRLDVPNKGFFLILRTLEKAYKVRSVATIAEDHKGNAALLSMFNFNVNTTAELDAVLPIGTVFIMKEPFVTFSCGELTIRSASMADVIIIDEGHKLFYMVRGIQWKNAIEAPPDPVTRQPAPRSFKEYLKRGFDLQEEGKISAAIRSYCIALQKMPKQVRATQRHSVYLHMATCYQKLDSFELALSHAQDVLKENPTNQQALLAAGSANYELRNFKAAKVCFETLKKINPKDEVARQEYERCSARLAEEGGCFNIYQAHLNDSLKPREKMDCGDYAGPVEIADVQGKGRGIIASRDITPGTLLVVSKALAFVWRHKDDLKRFINIWNFVDKGENETLIAMVADVITKNPISMAEQVYNLSIGKFQRGTTTSFKVFCDPENKSEPVVDVERIKQILTINGFGIFQRNSKPASELDRSLVEHNYSDYFGSGLFLFPSFFNHCCLPNATWQIFNDVMFIRAIKPIAAGEEVCLSYFHWALEFVKRQECCHQYGFICDCNLCQEDGKEDAKLRADKQRYTEEFNNVFLPKIKEGILNTDVDNLKQLILKCKSTFKNEGYDLRILCMMHSWLAIAYFKQGRYDKEIECHLETIRLFGFDPDNLAEALKSPEADEVFKNGFLCQEVLDVIQPLSGAFCASGQPDEMNKWIQVLLTMEKFYSGGDAEVVKLKYPRIKNLI